MDSLQTYERTNLSDLNIFDVSLHNDRCISSHVLLAQRSPFWRTIFCNRSGLFSFGSLEANVSPAVLELYFRQVNSCIQTSSVAGSDLSALSSLSAKRVCKYVAELRANAALLFLNFEEYLSFIVFLLDEQILFALWVYFEEILSQQSTFEAFGNAMNIYFRYLWSMVECLSVTHRFHSHELIDILIDYLLQNARAHLTTDHLMFISQQSNVYIECTLAQYIEWMCVNPYGTATYGHAMPLSSVDVCRFIDALDMMHKPTEQISDSATKKIRELMLYPQYELIRASIQELVFVSLLMNYSFTKDQASVFYQQITQLSGSGGELSYQQQQQQQQCYTTLPPLPLSLPEEDKGKAEAWM